MACCQSPIWKIYVFSHQMYIILMHLSILSPQNLISNVYPQVGRRSTCRCGTAIATAATSCTATASVTCRRRPACTPSSAPPGGRRGQRASSWRRRSWAAGRSWSGRSWCTRAPTGTIWGRRRWAASTSSWASSCATLTSTASSVDGRPRSGKLDIRARIAASQYLCTIYVGFAAELSVIGSVHIYR